MKRLIYLRGTVNLLTDHPLEEPGTVKVRRVVFMTIPWDEVAI